MAELLCVDRGVPTVMRGIMVARIGTHRQLLYPPKDAPAAFIAVMGLDSNVFTDPGFRCTPIIPKNSG